MNNNWRLMLSENRQVASIFFDVEMAFDSVSHDKLRLSLARTGISGPLLQCFLDHLTIDNELSWMVNPPVLLQPLLVYPKGPLLFIIFL